MSKLPFWLPAWTAGHQLEGAPYKKSKLLEDSGGPPLPLSLVDVKDWRGSPTFPKWLPKFEACGGVGQFGAAIAVQRYAGDLFPVGPSASRATSSAPWRRAGGNSAYVILDAT
ncbi:hypothetical protein E2562_024324 [Oryza meyeriana var. granulata]|uniref:Uncharacterized protein n=1 Tax=Oryza meyeriana var. granulata TaxID=110450 RepID=A0A6G1C8I5_9ORYZ|nr:hypothetical protein E2562_024324 [Oryza meyeriana var. granulata]